MKKNQSRVAKISHPNTPHHGLRAFIFSPITTIFFGTKESQKNSTKYPNDITPKCP
jgi:hypothetical protein